MKHYFLALMAVAAIVFGFTSCNNNEPEIEFSYIIKADIDLKVFDSEKQLDSKDPLVLNIVGTLNDIILTDPKAEKFVLQSADSSKIALSTKAILQMVDTTIAFYEDSLKGKGITLVGSCRIYGGFNSESVLNCIYNKLFGGYIDPTSSVKITFKECDFIVDGAQGKDGTLYFNGTKLRDIHFDYNHAYVRCNNGAGTYKLTVADQEATAEYDGNEPQPIVVPMPPLSFYTPEPYIYPNVY